MTFSDRPLQPLQPPQPSQQPWHPLQGQRRRPSAARVLMFVTVGVVLATAVAWHETGIVAEAWEACIVDGDLEGGDGFALTFGAVLLWGVQLVMIVPGMVLVLLARRRWIVVAVTTLLVVGGLVVAWKYFAWSDLPLQNEYCPKPQPVWWPTWLPPSPGPF